MILAIIGRIGAAGATGHVDRVRRRGDPRAVDGRPPDRVQHVDRGRRARRHGRARRHDLRLPRRPAARAAGRRTGTQAVRALAHAADATTARASTARSRSTAATIAPMVTWGTSPEDALPITGRVPDPADAADAERRDAMQRALDYMGLAPGTALDGHRGRPRVHRLLHQRPHRGPAQRRRGGRAAARVADGVEAWVVPGSGLVKRAGRGRRPRPRVPRRRLRVARRRLLDVPRHERRPGRARASAAPRPRTAISSAARGRARART